MVGSPEPSRANPSIYLDHAATTPVRSEVRDAMRPALEEVFGNPSSVHSAGRAGRALVDTARDQLAQVLGCRPREVVFTGGGSEADNLALRGVAMEHHSQPGHIIVSAIEHEAVLETARALEAMGFSLTVVPVDRWGLVDPESISQALAPQTILVSVMLANNEVGTIEPVSELARLVHEGSRALFHTDATQALGKLPLDVGQLGVDLLTVSAHKVYGPKGVGALYVRQGTQLNPQVTGGGQERTRRSGTENVPGIVGLGTAALLAERERAGEARRLFDLSCRLQSRILHLVPDAIPTGASPPRRLPNFCTLAFPQVEGELLLLRLDRAGVCASAGSACTSGSLAPSHVLLAMGLSPELAAAHLRLTLGRATTEEQVDRAAEIVAREVLALRRTPVTA
ncbi:MAG: cysteine desulfurase family protein [Candidatus Dormibacteraeota bacterium]|nr:cysteine desulfurase family protein [Candidatus Dormibacteraeota bacterium]